MNRFGKIAVCLAAGLAFGAGLRADELAVADTSAQLAGNPYAPIVTRNVFNLNPPAPPDTNTEPTVSAKIIPNGIMSIFGKSQVLFKVTGLPGKKEESYALSEGERQDDIEVEHIDVENSMVTFNNHGVTQDIPLAEPKSSGSSASSGNHPGTSLNNGGENNGNGNENGNGNIIRFGRRGGNSFGDRGGSNPGGATAGNNGASNLRSIPTRTYQPAEAMPKMTPEEQVILMEAQRAKYEQQNNPLANLIPPTPLTKYNTSDGGPPAPP